MNICSVSVDITEKVEERNLDTKWIQPFVIIRSITFVIDVRSPQELGMRIVMIRHVEDPDTRYLSGHFGVYFPKMVLSHEFGKFIVPNRQRIEPLKKSTKVGGKGVAREDVEDEVTENSWIHHGGLGTCVEVCDNRDRFGVFFYQYLDLNLGTYHFRSLLGMLLKEGQVPSSQKNLRRYWSC
ncbi:hypothetical protein Ddye_029514 [Dipteronia dyeriana]|uniref:Uncharacterized protein n=1 Tax=Dipteronia dyeriana TaxID=168575 RepID=A0AAD9TF95_9ROSI|nr:hypothetical protein Ddye_029514 [Dipteronia dyeriana]